MDTKQYTTKQYLVGLADFSVMLLGVLVILFLLI